MAPRKFVKQGERRFTKLKVAERIQHLKDEAGLPFNPAAVKAMSEGQIKKEIPRLFYEALWISVNVMLHEHLRSKDSVRKKAACGYFIDKLTDSSFIKNLALLREETKKDKDQPKAEWGK